VTNISCDAFVQHFDKFTYSSIVLKSIKKNVLLICLLNGWH